MKKIYTHEEITQRDLKVIIRATKRLSGSLGLDIDQQAIGLLNNMIFKFLSDDQVNYIIEKIGDE